MAMWKPLSQKDPSTSEGETQEGILSSLRATSPRQEYTQNNESLIASGLTIEGKIKGAGHVRVAGRFKGDVQVEGDLTIEPGAHISGEIQANNLVVKGEVEGNINASKRVELLESGVVIGDLKASSLSVAAGSRMRGMAEFGWGEQGPEKLTVAKGAKSSL